MIKNVGKTDKVIRLLLAFAFFPLLFLKTSPIKWFGLLSVPLLVTAIAQRCGAYVLIGTDTCERA